MVGERAPLSSVEQFNARISDLARRVHSMELALSRKSACGFHVTRTTSDTALASATNRDLTFTNLVEQAWGTAFNGWSSGSAFTVPAGCAGLYILSAHVYIATTTTSGLFIAVTVNNVAVASGAETVVGQSRIQVTSVGRLNVGDVIRLRLANTGGTAVTPTFFAGDVNTPTTPFLKAWRFAA